MSEIIRAIFKKPGEACFVQYVDNTLEALHEIGLKDGPMTKAQYGVALLWLKEHGEA